MHPTDHNLYSKRIVELLSDHKLCFAMGKSAREKVDRFFNIEKLALINIEFYKSVMHKN